MAETSLQGRFVLVVEDEFLLAEDLYLELTEAGAVVIGPAQSIERALELIALPGVLDVAILDINLRGTLAYPIADALLERHIPFVFTSGYDASDLPARFSEVKCYAKPISAPQVLEGLRIALGGDPGDGLPH